MANPFSRISHRRLMPFPGQASTSRRFCAASMASGYLLNGSSSGDRSKESTGCSLDAVKAFLTGHQDVLEEIVLDCVDTALLRKWAEKKTTRAARIDSAHPVKPPLLQEKYITPNILTVERELLKALELRKDILPYLYQLANVIGTAIRSDNVAMYVTRSINTDLYLYVPGQDSEYQLGLSGCVGPNSTVAAHVADTKLTVLVKDLQVDDRFPRGVGVEGSMTHSVLCVPVVLPSEDLLCIIQFGRDWQNPVYDDKEMQLVTAVVSWCGIAIHQHQVSGMLKKQRELNDFLMEISHIMFNDVVALDALVESIMTYSKDLIHADRCALFLVDEERQMLYANLFDEGFEEGGKPVFTRKDTIRFPIGVGIAGSVAQTGEIVNIKDAYSDPRFNRQVDRDTGYTTRNILCMPIMGNTSCLGVVQMINKVADSGEQSIGFTKSDEAAFKMFAVYCALALHYSKLFLELRRCTAENIIGQEMVAYHSLCTEKEAKRLERDVDQLGLLPADIESFTYYGPTAHADQLGSIYVKMLDNLFGEDTFNRSMVCRFVSTVKKNYRPVSYHNWHHGFNVSHSIFCFLQVIKDTGLLSDLRMKALMIGSLCHDIDHRGFNNAFYVKAQDPMADLYPVSVMENHHYTCTARILQQAETNLFPDLSREEYREFLEYVRHAIIATDLALHFGTQRATAKLIHKKELNLQDPEHMDAVISLMMTASDLSAVVKPWEVHRDTVKDIYHEFYYQGDLEKTTGDDPIPMLDRNNQDNMPKDQVTFIKLVCLPCYQTIAEIIPDASEMLVACRDNLEQWSRVVDGKSTSLWEPGKSRI